MSPAWLALTIAAFAGESGWSPQLEKWVLWQLPVERLAHYKHARAFLSGAWTTPPVDRRAIAARLAETAAADDGEFQV